MDFDHRYFSNLNPIAALLKNFSKEYGLFFQTCFFQTCFFQILSFSFWK
jgi:hypothetical protein